ncbi:COG3650 family protein [Pseudosulfitobacter pseudonitzschiae]|uniref:COG3650 family protein n=1 Tax=Pseudosulfitobacter pseudonitzschiae TaxID=1402135 RepID=UPI001AF3B58B|nr:peptide-binding protein [Pseudosulfitobacter pseudonitzschiae]MBM1815507.1 peptide-binding protein [Pseudosulfitobacter pseudonitzschiae]MBM1832498.1 peptide-binding protein [Pseudosulfitobacter pseudonitzschiae]MBM1837366.1 peptide-binding protein [Pseudosulfitobacter pseudonitzschiae]MBM1842212.1 peptide-binding protein [Pseudosulfitobacter pseudonitzschiae]MBM1847080.1 peptide-binding protein [Pseudosulfitobacter pseudonitzschiae]
MIRTLAVSLALLCWVPQAGWAFDFPALYHVIDVADDDVLNVRAQPDAQSAIIGTLLHDEADVEVMALSDDGKWGLINVGENAGWVAIRFLQHSGAPDRPLRARCGGTEPFWSLSLDATHVFRDPENGSQPYRHTVELSSPNTTNSLAILGRGPSGQMIATVDARACSDGMSDRNYGLSIGLVLTDEHGARYLTGCCSLSP